ncbi:hypothetical protein WK82_23305 [Burkholderia ubonensis]|nr:hypothetical protein WK82_23305 [Burkholderia ubonensis]
MILDDFAGHANAIIFDDYFGVCCGSKISGETLKRNLHPRSICVVGVFNYLNQRDSFVLDQLVPKHRQKTCVWSKFKLFLTHLCAMRMYSSE